MKRKIIFLLCFALPLFSMAQGSLTVYYTPEFRLSKIESHQKIA